MAEPSRKELTITRIFDAPRELVFKAWTDPKLLQQWWGPNMFTNPVCELDPRPGGRINVVMRGPDGMDNPMGGVFREVVEPERLVFTSTAFEDEAGHAKMENLNTVTFTDLGGKTQMTLHVVVLHADEDMVFALSGMEQGWNESLDHLASLLVKA